MLRLRSTARPSRLAPRRSFKPWLEVLEDRFSPAVDLSQFGTFLPQALTLIQQNGITGQIDSTGLPLIGNQLDQSTPPSASQILTPVQTSLQAAFKNVSSSTSESDFENALNKQLGNDGLLVGLVTRVSGDPTTNAVAYQVTVGIDQDHALKSNVNLDSKLGLAGLNINLSQNVPATLSVWYTDTVTFGVNDNVFYIDTSNSTLTMHVNVGLDPNASLKGSVGLLQFTATNGGSSVQMDYQGNLTASNNRLTLGSSFKYDGSTKITADVLLHLNAEFGLSTDSPTLQSDFVFNWTTSAKNPTSLSDFATAPQNVEFHNVQIKAQSFFQNVAGPILQQINNVIAPLDPIVNALHQKPLSQLGLDYTYEQILETFLGINPDDLSYFDAIANFIELASQASKAVNSANGTINLGSFWLVDPRSGNGGIASSSANKNALSDLKTAAPDFFSALTTQNGGTPDSDDTKPGLHLDFLNNPSQLFQLFVWASSSGNPPQLISYSLPTLKAGVAIGDKIIFTAPVPAFPVLTINVGIRGGIGLVGNLKMGYDAQGLIDYHNDPSKPSALLNGFYIDTTHPLLQITGWTKDPNNPNDPGQSSENIFSFFGNIEFDPKGELSAALSDLASQVGLSLPSWFGQAVSATVPFDVSAKGELSLDLKGEIDVGLNGGSSDRFRLSQLGSDNLFNASGYVSVGGELTLHAEASAVVPTVKVHFRKIGKYKVPDGVDIGTQKEGISYDKVLYSFPTIPLFSFGNSLVSGSTVQQTQSDPKLATFYDSDTKLSNGHQVSAGTLVLNVGPYAANRGVNPNDTNASYVVHHVSGSLTDQGGETVSIDAYGKTHQYSGVTAIYADTGDDSDSILLDDGVLSSSYLQAGSGTNTLKAGSGATTLIGGSGTDTLIAGPLAGVKNTIITSTGNTTVVGGAGDDTITIVGNGTNNITGGSGNDTVIAAGNSDFSLITDSSGNTQLIGDATSTLNQIRNVQLSGAGNGQSFNVQNWGGKVSLVGSGMSDHFNIILVGSGSSSYSVQDAMGEGALLVTGSPSGDLFTLKAGSLTDNSEQVNYSGIHQLTVQGGGNQPDIFNIQGTVAGTITTVIGGDTANLIHVSSNAGKDDNGDLSGIKGALYFDAGDSFANNLIISNYGSKQTQTALLATASPGYAVLTGMAPAPIYFTAATGSFFPFVGGSSLPGYDPDAGIILRGSSAQSDLFNIQSTPENATIEVEGNAVKSTFVVSSTAGIGGPGDVNSIAGLLILKGHGSDNASVIDTASKNAKTWSLTANTLSSQEPDFGGINYSGLANLNISLGSGGNTVEVTSTAAATTTTLNSGTGTNTINVGSQQPAINGNLVTIQGPLIVQSIGIDTLNVDNSSIEGPKSGTLTPTSLLGLGMGPKGIAYSGLSALNLNMGPSALGRDTFDITDVNVASLVTGPTYAFFNQIPVGKLTVAGNIGSVHVHTGVPGSFAGPTATVTLFEGYSPWLLREVIDQPINNNGGNGGTPSSNPTTTNPSNSRDPQSPFVPPEPASNGGSSPADPFVTMSPPSTNQQGDTPPTAPGSTITAPIITLPAPIPGTTPVVGNAPLSFVSLPPSGNGTPVSFTVPDSPLSPWLALFELELKMVQMELAQLESFWFQILSNFQTLFLH